MKYQAQSPDEAALVTAARCFGYVFTNRSPDTITVSRLDEEITFEVLHIADFDNVRKRMSVGKSFELNETGFLTLFV